MEVQIAHWLALHMIRSDKAHVTRPPMYLYESQGGLDNPIQCYHVIGYNNTLFRWIDEMIDLSDSRYVLTFHMDTPCYHV